MKVKKGFISYVMVFCMLLVGISYAYVGASSNGQQGQVFSDVEGHWCADVIEKFAENNWVIGYGDGFFRPDRLVTRAEFTAMVVNIFKEIEETIDSNFSDVKKEDWFYNSVAYASKEKLIQGYEDGTFRAMDNMSRQDAAVLAEKLFDVGFFEGVDENAIKFVDEETFPEYSYQSIKNLASHEIIKGYPDGTFKPLRLITRAEAIKMLDVLSIYVEIPGEEVPQAPPEIPSPTNAPETPTLTPTPTPKATPVSSGGSSRKETPKPIVVGRTYSSTEDFSDGVFNNISTRVKDALILKDIKIENNPVSYIYGNEEDLIYIEFETSTDKSILLQGSDKVVVMLKMIGVGDPDILERAPMDLVITIDDSGSMEWGNTDNIVETPNRLDFAMEASKNIVNMLQHFDRGAVLGFAGSAWIQQKFTYDKELLIKGIDDTPDSPWDGTAIGVALRDSIDMILSESYPENKKAILLLTDGADNVWSYSEIINQAKRAKENDIVILCVGLGNSIDQKLLKEIAEITNGTYSYSPTMEELKEMMYRSGDSVEVFDKAGDNILLQTTLSSDVEADFSQEPSNIIENLDGSKTYQWESRRLNMGEENSKILSFEFENLEDGDLISILEDIELTYVSRDNQTVLVEAEDILMPVSSDIKSGTWEVVFDSKNSNTKWGNISWDGKVYNDGSLNIRVLSSKDNKTYSEPVNVSSGKEFSVPDGRYIKIQAEFNISSDGYSPELFDITIGSKGYPIKKQSNNSPNIEKEDGLTIEVGESILLTPLVTGERNMTFNWEVTEGDFDSVDIENEDSFTTNVVFNTEGTYTITLTVNDGENISVSDVEVIVEGEKLEEELEEEL